ncbi:polysaccharide lyase [Litchfieldella xinjiangensis]|uniref:polysaccharide lyase n=1 Tax=Litchfieldella xinjiangensis TaxID=1166948 RepID=UPI001E59860B|nr:hypothetical protein [Halomonas xinjiangensis]
MKYSQHSLLRPARSQVMLSSLALVALTSLSVQADEGEDEAQLSTPTVAQCSERYTQVSSPEPAMGLADAQEAIREGFQTKRDWGTDKNVEILSPSETGLGEPGFRVLYPEGTSSPGDTEEGGAGFYADVPSLDDRACLQYQVRFEYGFDYVKGGKLPGLYGGNSPSGGETAEGDEGFSMRFMWRENGKGELYEYVASQSDEDDYGDSVGRGEWVFPSGQWVTVEQEVVLNTPGESDGIARVWIDGRPVLEQSNIVYRTTPSLTIDGMMFSTFFGGHGEEWRTPRDQTIDFAAFRFYAPR